MLKTKVSCKDPFDLLSVFAFLVTKFVSFWNFWGIVVRIVVMRLFCFFLFGLLVSVVLKGCLG